MTNGRGLVLGDPGPWICAGMTGGVIYVRHQPEVGLTKDAIQRRIAKGAKVICSFSYLKKEKLILKNLLGQYTELLAYQGQSEEAANLQNCLKTQKNILFKSFLLKNKQIHHFLPNDTSKKAAEIPLLFLLMCQAAALGIVYNNDLFAPLIGQ